MTVAQMLGSRLAIHFDCFNACICEYLHVLHFIAFDMVRFLLFHTEEKKKTNVKTITIILNLLRDFRCFGTLCSTVFFYYYHSVWDAEQSTNRRIFIEIHIHTQSMQAILSNIFCLLKQFTSLLKSIQCFILSNSYEKKNNNNN